MKKLFVLILLATATFTQAKNIYVAPNGSDAAAGTILVGKQGRKLAQLQMGYAWEKETSGVEQTIIQKDNEPCGIYNLQGQRVQQMQRGKMYIVNGKKVYLR